MRKKIKIHFTPIWISGGFNTIFWIVSRTIVFLINQFTILYMGLFLNSNYFHCSISFWPISHCLNYCSCIVHLEKQVVQVFQHCSFFFIIWLFYVFYIPIWILTPACQFLPKIMLVFVLDYTESIDKFEKKNLNLNNIESSKTLAWYFSHLFCSS